MNRELLKNTTMFVLDLAMELEYQRLHPRRKCVEHGDLDFTFDGEGECVVRHQDGRLGEISIDPDEISVDVSYRRKSLTINVQSDKRLAPRDIMDIIGDFLDYVHQEDEPVAEVKRTIAPQPASTKPPILKWLLIPYIEYLYKTRDESLSGLDYEMWYTQELGLGKQLFDAIQSTSLEDISEMTFVNTMGELGYLPQENFDDNVRTLVNLLIESDTLPLNLTPLCIKWMPKQ